MAMNVQQRGAKFQLRVSHKLLPKPFFHTFDDEQEARNYGTQLEALLAAGVVPGELLAPEARPGAADPMLAEVIGDYQRLAPVTTSDDELLVPIRTEVAGTRVSGVTMLWAERYVAALKAPGRERGPLTPGSIRKRVGALARVLDWHFHRARGADKDAVLPVNVLRLMPRGYSLYTKSEAEALGGAAPADEARDYRLPAADEAKLWAALAGEKRPDRERALAADPEFQMLTAVVLDTGVRLSEGMTLRVDQVDLGRRLLHVDGSKGHRGKIKPRVVPIKRRLLERLQAYLPGRQGLLFPSMWDGDPDTKRKAAHRLSVRFGVAMDYAGLPHLREHDLRHEATCRWFELRDEAGRWVFSDIEICRIMGWTDTKLALRYASLRGEDLAARLGDF